MATHSSILAWEIRWTEEPGRLQSIGSQKSRTGLNNSTAQNTCNFVTRALTETKAILKKKKTPACQSAVCSFHPPLGTRFFLQDVGSSGHWIPKDTRFTKIKSLTQGRVIFLNVLFCFLTQRKCLCNFFSCFPLFFGCAGSLSIGQAFLYLRHTGASLVAVGGLTSCDAQASLVVGSLVAAHRLSCPEVVLVAQSCPTLCDPMDCSPPGSSVHGISQARI